jgi:hypothetical protein
MSRSIVLIATALLFLTPSSSAQSARYLHAIEVFVVEDIANGGQAEAVSPKRFTNFSRSRTVVDLELGESIEGQEIVLHPRPGASSDYRIEQQVETSLTVMDEGPHLDLREWKHNYSAWRRLESVGQNRFRVNHVSDAESYKFPKVSPAEIRAAVRRAGGPRWARLVRDVKGPHDYPSAVSVSKIKLRVSVREGGRWRVVNTLDFLIPMGC